MGAETADVVIYCGELRWQRLGGCRFLFKVIMELQDKICCEIVLKHGYQLHVVHCLDSSNHYQWLQDVFGCNWEELWLHWSIKLLVIAKMKMTDFSYVPGVYSYGAVIHPLIEMDMFRFQPSIFN